MEVNVYSTPTCSFCQQLKHYLKEKKVTYIDHDLTEDKKARDLIIEKTGQLATPVIDVGGTWIVGFDKEKIEKALVK